MRLGLLALALLLAGMTAGGCLLTRRLVDPYTLPPQSYGEFLGVERHGPGEDLFIYRIEGHTGARAGYYAVQPAAEPRSGAPKVLWLEHGDTIAREALYEVPVLPHRGRRGDAAPAAHAPDQPAYRIVRLDDELRREMHGYERWSPERKRWERIGACAMGTRRYRVKEHPATVLLLLPFTLVLDILLAPIQFFMIIGRQALRDIVRTAERAATTAVLGAAHRRVERRLR